MKLIKLIQAIIKFPFWIVLFILSPFLLALIFLSTDLDSERDTNFGKRTAKMIISLGFWK